MREWNTPSGRPNMQSYPNLWALPIEPEQVTTAVLLDDGKPSSSRKAALHILIYTRTIDEIQTKNDSKCNTTTLTVYKLIQTHPLLTRSNATWAKKRSSSDKDVTRPLSVQWQYEVLDLIVWNGRVSLSNSRKKTEKKSHYLIIAEY